MEAFGRVIAVLMTAVCLVFLTMFFKTASVDWQKNETVHSITTAYAAQILRSKIILQEEKKRFVEEMRRLGDYEIEITVYERRRYEDSTGRIYLYSEWEGEETEKMLSSGSYLRVEVKEMKRGKLRTFMYGSGCTVVAGGRIP